MLTCNLRAGGDDSVSGLVCEEAGDGGLFAYMFRWTESLKKVLKKGLKKVTELKKSTKKK